MIDVVCNLCNSSNRTTWIVEKGLPVCVCSDCGFIYVGRRPQRDENEDVNYFIDRKHIQAHSARYRDVFAYYAAKITQLKPEKGSLLDVGCGYGLFMQNAHQQGWDVHGLDVAANATEYARDELGLANVQSCELAYAGFNEHQFDCVTLWNVLEHVPDAVAVLRDCHNVMKDGALVVVRVPNIGFVRNIYRCRHLLQPVPKLTGANIPIPGVNRSVLSGWPPHHLYGFTPATLRRALEKVGFSRVDLQPAVLSRGTHRSALLRPLSLLSKTARVVSLGNCILSPTMTAFAYK